MASPPPLRRRKYYLVETNRSKRTTRQNARRLQARGFDVTRLPRQPTVMIAEDLLGRRGSANIRLLAQLADNRTPVWLLPPARPAASTNAIGEEIGQTASLAGIDA